MKELLQQAVEAPSVLDVGFKYENGVHTPTALVGFPPNDFNARDAFVRNLAALQQQEVPSEPVAWLIEYDVNGSTRRVVFQHNAIGDYQAMHPSARSTPLHASSPSTTRQQEAGSGWCNKCGARPTTPEHKRPDGSDCPYLATGLAGMAVLDGGQR